MQNSSIFFRIQIATLSDYGRPMKALSSPIKIIVPKQAALSAQIHTVHYGASVVQGQSFVVCETNSKYIFHGFC